MNFTDVMNDIHKLVGLELNSIRPGAKITITYVDEERGSLILRTSSGQNRSRPIDELQKIWNELMVKPAVHVEGVLHGSGTSRNQPETILANLPYIEWLKVDNKKHIAFIGKKTHAYGTLKKVDAFEASKIVSKMKSEGEKAKDHFSTVIATKDINASIESIQNVCGGFVSTVERGFYQLQTQTDLILFLSADIWELEEGTYCVIETGSPMGVKKGLSLYGNYYSVLCNGNIKAFIKNPEGES